MALSPDRADAHQRDLADYQAVIMKAVRAADAELDQAEGAEALAGIVSTLHKAGRALRQSMALEAKLARDADRDAAALTEKAVETRKAQIRHVVGRLIWTEHERLDAQVFSAELDELLDAEAREAGFLDQPLDDQIVRLGRVARVRGRGGRRYLPAAVRGQFDHINRRHGWREGPSHLADRLDPDGGEEPVAPPVAAPAPAVAKPRKPRPAPNPDPFNGRLAPPMDLPSWECDDDSS
jgi:hypothetical protein